MNASLPQRLLAEALGTLLLLAVVIGSGIMAERLSGGNVAIALLANTLATVGGLVVPEGVGSTSGPRCPQPASTMHSSTPPLSHASPVRNGCASTLARVCC